MDYKKELRNFLNEDGVLKQYPSKRNIRMVALAYIAEQFEKGRGYTEKEVNEIIKRLHTFSDHELLRRELFTYGFINRKRDGSIYWLEDKIIQ